MILYILENKKADKYYIGITKDIQRRIKEHNEDNGHYTGKIDGTWKIVYEKIFEFEKEARKEERRLKKAKNKKYIKWYIENNV